MRTVQCYFFFISLKITLTVEVEIKHLSTYLDSLVQPRSFMSAPPSPSPVARLLQALSREHCSQKSPLTTVYYFPLRRERGKEKGWLRTGEEKLQRFKHHGQSRSRGQCRGFLLRNSIHSVPNLNLPAPAWMRLIKERLAVPYSPLPPQGFRVLTPRGLPFPSQPSTLFLSSAH